MPVSREPCSHVRWRVDLPGACAVCCSMLWLPEAAPGGALPLRALLLCCSASLSTNGGSLSASPCFSSLLEPSFGRTGRGDSSFCSVFSLVRRAGGRAEVFLSVFLDQGVGCWTEWGLFRNHSSPFSFSPHSTSPLFLGLLKKKKKLGEGL